MIHRSYDSGFATKPEGSGPATRHEEALEPFVTNIETRRWILGVVWTAVGLMLFWRGLPYAGLRHTSAVQGLVGGSRWVALGAGFLLGVAKGLVALRTAARHAVAGIVSRGRRAPAWTVLTPPMIALVLGMVVLGAVLRLAPYDPQIKAWLVGCLYPAIGTALIVGGYFAVRLPEPGNEAPQENE